MKPPIEKITVLLADDHVVVREGFRRMLEGEPDILVVGEAHTGRETVAMVKKLKPAIVLMDIAMPSLNGLEATRQIVLSVPETKVIILSAHSDDAYVDEATAAGTRGFLLKQTSSHIVVEAIREVVKGNTYFSKEIAKRFNARDLHEVPKAGSRKSRHSTLTSRELEVLQLIAEGKANKQTADELGIGIKTVEKHREHLMSKLDIHDTAGLTRYAISAGIIESSVQVTII
jgi:DNA-binding NarL/FixJ family response regulator